MTLYPEGPVLANYLDHAAYITDWLEWRRTGIGASDTSIICGVTPPSWGSPLSIYLDKTGESEPRESSIAMELGHFLEPFIAAKFTQQTGIEVVQEQVLVRSLLHPFMIASIDRLTTDGISVQLKNTSHRIGDDPDDLPRPMVLQVQHEMECLGTDRCYLAILTAGTELLTFEIHRNQTIIDSLVAILEDFWSLVENRTPPQEFQEGDAAILKSLFGEAQGFCTLGEIDALAATEFQRLPSEIKALEHQKELAECRLLASMAGSRYGELPDGRTVKVTKSEIAAGTSKRRAYTQTRVTVKEAKA